MTYVIHVYRKDASWVNGTSSLKHIRESRISTATTRSVWAHSVETMVTSGMGQPNESLGKIAADDIAQDIRESRIAILHDQIGGEQLETASIRP
jgi:hypothetical protein